MDLSDFMPIQGHPLAMETAVYGRRAQRMSSGVAFQRNGLVFASQRETVAAGSWAHIESIGSEVCLSMTPAEPRLAGEVIWEVDCQLNPADDGACLMGSEEAHWAVLSYAAGLTYTSWDSAATLSVASASITYGGTLDLALRAKVRVLTQNPRVTCMMLLTPAEEHPMAVMPAYQELDPAHTIAKEVPEGPFYFGSAPWVGPQAEHARVFGVRAWTPWGEQIAGMSAAEYPLTEFATLTDRWGNNWSKGPSAEIVRPL